MDRQRWWAARRQREEWLRVAVREWLGERWPVGWKGAARRGGRPMVFCWVVNGGEGRLVISDGGTVVGECGRGE